MRPDNIRIGKGATMKKISFAILGAVLITAVVFFVSGLFSGSRALALVVQKDVEQLTHEADLILIGKVKSMRSQWNSERTLIYTYVTVSISEYVKKRSQVHWWDESMEKEVVVRILGGEVDSLRLMVSGTPEFGEGEEVFLFLRRRMDGEPFLKVAGLFQGKYTVENGTAKNKVLGLEIPIEQFTSHVREMVNEQGSRL